MSISKLYESGIQKRNTLHFAIIAKMALVDGAINDAEQQLLNSFIHKLSLGESEVNYVLSHIDQYPIPTVSSKEERLEYLYELFQMIYADHEIDEPEMRLIYKYAIGLGFNEIQAKQYIEASIKIFSAKISFEEYMLFNEILEKKAK